MHRVTLRMGAVLVCLVPSMAFAQGQPVPPPHTPFVDVVSLRVMHDKGLITDQEYQSALAEIGQSVGQERAADSLSLVVSKWSATLYGFLEGDFIFDSTQSFNDMAGNALVLRPVGAPQPASGPVSQWGGSNPRLQFGVRNTRFGLRLRAPEFHRVRASGTLEMDFLGVDPSGPSTTPTSPSEQGFFDNPTLRVRLAYLRIETPIVDLLVGQYWHLFGWQPYYFPNSTEIQGLPGELYERTPQVRLSHKFVIGSTSLEIAAAALRPPTRDGAVPDLTGGLRFTIDGLRGVQTTGATATAIMPASIAVSGDYRNFRVPVFAQEPTQTVELATGAIAVDAFIPIIPALHGRKSSLSISGELVYGGGISDMYTNFNGGITMPSIVNMLPINPPPPYPQNVDDGMVVFDNGPHNLHAIIWQTAEVGLQWYPPGANGHVWIAGNYAHTESPNIAQFTQTQAPSTTTSNYADAATVRQSEDWFDANVFIQPISSVRFGFEYACFIDHYVDGVQATNHRGQISGYFLF